MASSRQNLEEMSTRLTLDKDDEGAVLVAEEEVEPNKQTFVLVGAFLTGKNINFMAMLGNEENANIVRLNKMDIWVSNQRRILISQYEGFMVKPKESITDVFEREVRDLSRITLEVLYGILRTYELEIIHKKSLRSGQGHVVDGSSALIINEIQTSNDEPRSQTPVASTSEQRTNDSQEQVIPELEKDEFYTLEELDELDESMAYLARKFSNIRVKKPRYFKSKGQSFNKDSSWKDKGKYNSDSKNGYKTGYIDRSKKSCFNCDELGHFATECRKPKKAKKDKVYLELEAKYEALLKKQQSKAYIAEGESSSSKSQVPTFTTIDPTVNQYKETVEKMSTKMFYIHTSMVAANEKVSRLTKINEKLESEKQETELLLVELEALKQENAYLKNKLKCANKIEAVLREKLEKNEVKLNSFRNASKLKTIGDKGKSKKTENAPTFLKEINAPIFKACEVNFSEEQLIIKQEIADEDEEKKMKNQFSLPILMRSSWTKKVPRLLLKKPKLKMQERRRKIEMGHFAYVADVPRKKCEKCGSVNHLTHICKKGKVKKVIWIIDSGCSRHTTGDKALLSQFEEKDGPLVTFRDNNKAFTMGYDNIVSGNIVIDDVALVAGLEVNLLSVGQFADKEKGKMKRSSHKSKTVNSISAPLQLIHMDLFGPVNILSISRNKYALVMVDNFSRYTWVEFMHSKDETSHIKKIEKQAEDHNCVKSLRSDNETEFINAILSEFCKSKGIVQELSASRTPQQNGVVERKNRTLVEADRTMLQDANKFLGRGC
ncbi:hypothetical protein AgCh_035490 [Apium graveolens]